MALGMKVVEMDVFGEKVFIRTLNGGKTATTVIDLLQQVSTKPSLIAEIGAMLVVACLCDSSGKPLYSDPDVVREDSAIGFLTAFVEVALDHSGLSDDAKEIKKNSEAQLGNSNSSLQESLGITIPI